MGGAVTAHPDSQPPVTLHFSSSSTTASCVPLEADAWRLLRVQCELAASGPKALPWRNLLLLLLLLLVPPSLAEVL
jgi:hypothetical protein